ncbi:MAG: pyruvate dehydrogenase (acetyl-transferring), homodimeric type [Psychroflexus sp.]|nr:pyruvate dehydrogenase (acetyl-transferring), homodimeric type [Psychroflexus sp.]
MSKSDQENNITQENQEWLASLRWVIENEPEERVAELLNLLQMEAQKHGISSTLPFNTPYVNTISTEDETAYPGDLEIEHQLSAYIRWNAMAMVVKANERASGIGGHISTYGSIADLWEVGFNHFFKTDKEGDADSVYFQGHASPGIYSRAFLEGRLDKKNLDNFRFEVQSDKGLSSYPHPHLMPDFWNFPTVSMGLGPIQAIYRARFNKYMYKRGITKSNDQRVWAFLGDGEMDETEARGAISVAARDKLDKLTFVVDCNLQRLDGPVRGNQKIIQELEALFKGAGWNVIKVLWGKDWDPLFEKDKADKMLKILNKLPDGQLQKYAHATGDFMRKDFFGRDKNLEKLVENYTDSELKNLKRGGHDPLKIYNAYKAAVEHKDQPTIILAQTIKGYGQGSAGEASNVSHKTKTLNKEERKHFRDFFDVPISDKDLEDLPFIKPEKDSKEAKYLQKKRKDLGGFIPQRKDNSPTLKAPDDKIYESFLNGSGDDDAGTTMVMVQLLGQLLKDENVKDLIIPIIPDESRTFGMESLFRQAGIYAPEGQQYEPVDEDSLLYYNETEEGAIMEEGITEAGCTSEYIAAGTTYLTHGINTIPFYFFYAMFGFQRTADLIWAAADAKAKGFLIGGISGRTSLSGEGLQHADGQSHLYALAFPNLKAYDPAFAYEVATIVKHGIKDMFVDKNPVFYYLTVGNDTYQMPEMLKGAEEGILKGLYRFKKSNKKTNKKVHLFGSGAIMNEVQKASEILEKEYDAGVDIWSVTSYKALYDDAIDTERQNRLKAEINRESCYVQKCLKGEKGTFVAASDYVKALPQSIASWFPEKLTCLGTDGFGRSDDREPLRDFFEVSHQHIVYAALYDLAGKGKIKVNTLKKAAKDLNINPGKNNPRTT